MTAIPPRRSSAQPPVSASEVLAVWAGGACGTVCRWVLGQLVPKLAGLPAATVGINVLGSLLLGVLLEILTRSGPDEGRRRLLRLGLGTGGLGGFTTYSALSVDTALLARSGSVGLALAYAVGTVLVGLGAAAAGIGLAGRWTRGRQR